ncbi:MAG: VPLPA-CTERM sorting domain-containing protein [Paracoccaceae bacterium]|nr:VPLPA-CTERM sorting domain-containing protein [Paracoccaceae bacterium]
MGALLALANAAGAATTEPPDFADSTPGTSLGTLPEGVTTISGALSATCEGQSVEESPIALDGQTLSDATCTSYTDDSDRVDAFSLVIPSSGLAAASLTISGLPPFGLFEKEEGFFYTDLAPAGLLLSDGTQNVASYFQIGSNTVEVVAGLRSLAVEPSVLGDTVAFDWSLELTVQTTGEEPPGPPVIPLPAGLPLLLAGLASLGLAARRRR